jgi:lipid A disaccharide synthetase
LLFIAYNTILVACYTRTVALKITGLPIIIACRVRAVSFKITSLTTVVIKLRSFLKRTISIYITGKQTEMVF